MSSNDASNLQRKKVTITIPNVPLPLWQAFQDEAKRQNSNVASLIMSLMAGAAGFDLAHEENS